MLAAVFAPVTGEFFFGARGKGATRNDVPLQATSGTALDFSRIAGPKPLVQRLSEGPEEISLYPELDRWRCGCAGGAGHA